MKRLIIAILFVALQPMLKASDEQELVLWIGRALRARLLETGILKCGQRDIEQWPTVEHVILDVGKVWPRFSPPDKQAFVLAVLLYGGTEGGALNLLDRLIGSDSDNAVETLTLTSVELSERFGYSDVEAVRLAKLLNDLKSRRAVRAR